MDTPLAARTKQKSLAGFNERGLMNTSMANEGAMGALLDSSFKIADADANRIGNLALGATEELGRNTRQEDQQTWQSGENTLDRSHRTSERLGAESFTGGQNALDRAWRTGERLGTETFTAGQNALDRSLTTTLQDDAQEHGVLMQDDAQAHGVTLQDDSQDFTGQQNELDRSATADLQDDSQLFTSGENALDRAATADNARENRDWQERQNLGAQTFQRETRDSQNQWQASQTQATRDFELMLAERGWDRADAKEIERLCQETYGSYTNAMGGVQASYTAAILKINQSDLPPDVKASQIDALNTLFGRTPPGSRTPTRRCRTGTPPGPSLA